VYRLRSAIAAVLWVLTSNTAAAQLMSTCVANSPERRGEFGCSIVVRELLPNDLPEPLFWHIDRLDSLQQDHARVDSTSFAFAAAGEFWLVTVESQTSQHHRGEHVARGGPLSLPRAARYAIQIQTAAFGPGMYSVPHHHSGVEVVYVLAGEACYETPTRAAKLHKGETVAIPAGTPHRAVVTGLATRHVFALIVYDASQPPTTPMEMGTGSQLVPCQ